MLFRSLLVVVQGAIGGARVLLDDKTVAKVHACTGPLFFAVAVAIATLTRGTSAARPTADVASGPVSAGRLAAGLVVASYVQLVAGAQLRHLDATVDPATFRWLVAFHLVGAAAVTLLAGAAVFCQRSDSCPSARRWSRAILLLIGLQLALGAGAWVVNWGVPSGWLPASWAFSDPIVARSFWGATVVTGHVVLGMLILGAAVVLAIASGVLTPASAASAPLRMEHQRERAFA